MAIESPRNLVDSEHSSMKSGDSVEFGFGFSLRGGFKGFQSADRARRVYRKDSCKKAESKDV